METMLDKIKDRVIEKDCPIKSVKALAEAVGMSEGGFYSMVKRGTTKVKTLEAICQALGVSNDYFDEPNTEKNLPSSDFGGDVLQRVTREIQEIRHNFEEQLRVKDRQLEAKDTQIELLLGLLGKFEGATADQLSEVMSMLNVAYNGYVFETVFKILSMVKPTKLMLSHSSKVSGTQLSHADNMVITN